MDTCEKHGTPLTRPEWRDPVTKLVQKAAPQCADCNRDQRSAFGLDRLAQHAPRTFAPSDALRDR